MDQHYLHLLVTEKYLQESSSYKGVHLYSVPINIYLLPIIHFRPGVPLALATSLSEGEVPHSPGEAQWYAMYTARMNQAGLVGWNDKSKRKLDLTRVSVKSSPDPTSTDSSNLSEDPQKVQYVVKQC